MTVEFFFVISVSKYTVYRGKAVLAVLAVLLII